MTMAPIIRTAEYNLLTVVRDELNVLPDKLNAAALSLALSNEYVKYDGEYVVLTNEGFDRIDQIED